MNFNGEGVSLRATILRKRCGAMKRAQGRTGAAACLILAALLSVTAAGCAGRARVYRDVMESRREAYEQWLVQREAADAAQVRIEGKLSLQDALKLSVANNKTLQAALEERGVARGRIVEAMGEALPSAEVRADYTRLDKVAGFNVGGQGVSLGDPDNYSVDLTVTQPLYRGGAIRSAIRAARVYAVFTDEQVRGVTQQMFFDVAMAYYEVLLAQQLVEVAKDSVEASRRSLKLVESRKALGTATKLDVLRTQVELSNFQAVEIKQRNLVNRGKTTLLKLMGVSQDSNIELSGKLTYSEINPVYEDAVKTAFENRPDIFTAELQVRMQREAFNVAFSRYFPSLDAFYTQTWAKPDPHTNVVDWGDAWKAGVTLDWTLFDLRREGKLMQEASLLRRDRIELIDAEERALREIRAAILSINDAREFVDSQRLNQKRAEEGLRLAMVGQEQGINTEVEVYDARAALTLAKANYYQAIYDHTVARLILQRAMGILGPHAGASVMPKDVKTPKPAYIKPFMKEKDGAPSTKTKETTPAQPPETHN